MTKQEIPLKKIVILFFCVFAFTLGGCKKEKQEEKAVQNLIGVWVNVTFNSTYRSTITEYDLKANGVGNEIIAVAAGSTYTVTSDENFKWTTENEKMLKLQFGSDPEELYGYVLDKEKGSLTLTSASGTVREYLKDRN